MKLSLADLRLESRAALIADICEELRAGLDPWPRVEQELGRLAQYPEELEFVCGIVGVLQPEKELQWA